MRCWNLLAGPLCCSTRVHCRGSPRSRPRRVERGDRAKCSTRQRQFCGERQGPPRITAFASHDAVQGSSDRAGAEPGERVVGAARKMIGTRVPSTMMLFIRIELKAVLGEHVCDVGQPHIAGGAILEFGDGDTEGRRIAVKGRKGRIKSTPNPDSGQRYDKTKTNCGKCCEGSQQRSKPTSYMPISYDAAGKASHYRGFRRLSRVSQNSRSRASAPRMTLTSGFFITKSRIHLSLPAESQRRATAGFCIDQTENSGPLTHGRLSSYCDRDLPSAVVRATAWPGVAFAIRAASCSQHTSAAFARWVWHKQPDQYARQPNSGVEQAEQ